MGATYTRQESANITDGSVIEATHFNNEFNQLESAFASSTGHSHDGTAAEGGYVPLIADLDANNKIVSDTSNNRFGVFVEVGGSPVEQFRFQDGAIVPVTDNDIDLGTGALEFKDLYIDGTANIDTLVIGSSTGITSVDTDLSSVSASDDTLASAKAIKTYIDAQVTAQDLDFQADTGGALSIDLDSESLTFTGGTGIDTSGSGNAVTFAIDSTVATLTGTQTLTNKTVNLTNNTLTGTTAEFNTALSDGSFATLAGTETLTNKTFNLTSNTLTGTTAQFNTALSDGSFATLAGSETLTNKTIDVDNNTVSNIEVDNFKSGVLDTDLSTVSASDDTLASAKAIKAYVDAQVTASDLDFQGDSGGALSIDLDSETLTVAGGTGIDTSGSGNTLTVAIDSTVATLTGTQTLTNKTIDSASNTLTLDLSEGTLTGTTAEFNTALSDGSFATLAGTETLTNKTIDVDNNTVSNIEVDNLKSGVLDTDLSTVSASDDTLASAKAIKAYVDSQVTAQDLDFQGDSGGALSIDLDSETLTIAGGTGIDTSGSLNTLTVAIDSTVATLTGTQTLTNKTLTSPVLNTSVSGTAFLDDDTFATASATTLASSESIKAYVDSAVATANELSELTDVNITTPADGALLFYDTGTSKWIDNVVSGDITIADTGVAAISSGVIVNADINASAGIDATKIAGGTVDNTEFGYLNGVTSAIQTQLTAKLENLSEDTTPQLGGNLDLNSNDITGTGNIDITGNVTQTNSVGSSTLTIDGSSPNDSSIFLNDAGSNSYSLFKDGSQSDDLRIISYGDTAGNTDVLRYSKNGSLKFQTGASDRVIIDSSGNVGIGTSSPTQKLQVSGNILLGDNNNLYLGTSGDFAIYHDGFNSYIKDQGTGNLNINGSSNIYFNKGDGSEVFAHFADDGAVRLRYDNVTKFETTSTGIQTTGTVNVNGAYSLPTSDGTSGQVLQTDGLGNVSFATPSAAGATQGFAIAMAVAL